MKNWRIRVVLVIGLLLIPGTLLAQDVNVLRIVNQINLLKVQTDSGQQSPFIQDVWSEGNLAVVSGSTLVHLVDLSNIVSPQSTIIELPDGAVSWDAKLQNGILYVALQESLDGASMLIYDVSDAESPEFLSSFVSETFGGAHNLFVKENVAFIATLGAQGSPRLGLRPTGGRVWAIDVSDSSNPIEIGALLDTRSNTLIGQVHDLTVIGNRGYLAAWSNGFYIIDFENLDDPQNLSYEVVGQHIYDALPVAGGEEPSTHNVWPSADGNLLWTTDEVTGEGVRVFDISDLENIHMLGVFSLTGSSIPHNVVIDGDTAYVAYYRSGLRVLELDPEFGPVERMEFDTTGESTGSLGIFTGAWGVYPFGDLVLVSDMFAGLSIFEKDELAPENVIENPIDN